LMALEDNTRIVNILKNFQAAKQEA